jgi:alpha-tubulin suppressor-like RCC1 family protein
MLRLRAILAVGLAVAAACNDETGPNISGLEPLAISHVKIQPNVDTIFVEDTIGPSDTTHLAGTVVMKNGEVLTDAALAWQSRNPQVATVNSAGTVQATGYGVATIVASAGEAATATVVVVPRFEQDTLPNIVGVASRGTLATGGEVTCVLTNRQRVFCSGNNELQQLGSAARDTVCFDAYRSIGNQAALPCSLVPLRATSEERFTNLTVGGAHACALNDAGTAFCWGEGDLGQLGNGTTGGSPTPKLVSALHRFRSIEAGSGHTCAVGLDGTAWCWGADDQGQLGNERLRAFSTTPIPVDGGRTDWAQLTTGGSHTCGLTTSGAAFCWGSNEFGQLGTGTGSPLLSPAPVLGGIVFAAISAGDATTCGIALGGTAYCWGEIPGSAAPAAVAGGAGYSSISVGGMNVCGVRGGAAVCWGTYDLGVQGPQGLGPVPVLVPNAPGFVAVETSRRHACGLTATGEVQCWGSNVFGPFGDGLQALWRPSPQRFVLPER